MIAPPSILVGTTDRTAWIRVEGKGSFVNSTGLKDFAREMTNRGFREFVVDLKNCPVMDSTFMGTLAGMALRLRDIGHGRLCVINLNERNRDLLANLGLDQLFAMDVKPGSEPAEACREALTTNGTEDKATRLQTMLVAHEACVEANPENAAKFKDVLEYLKQDLHRSR